MLSLSTSHSNKGRRPTARESRFGLANSHPRTAFSSVTAEVSFKHTVKAESMLRTAATLQGTTTGTHSSHPA